MGDDPVKSWMWTPDEIHSGALKNFIPEEAKNLFKRHAEQVDQFL